MTQKFSKINQEYIINLAKQFEPSVKYLETTYSIGQHAWKKVIKQNESRV